MVLACGPYANLEKASNVLKTFASKDAIVGAKV